MSELRPQPRNNPHPRPSHNKHVSPVSTLPSQSIGQLFSKMKSTIKQFQ